MCSLQELQSTLYFKNTRGQRDGPTIDASAVKAQRSDAKAAEEEVDDENEDDEEDDVSLITCLSVIYFGLGCITFKLVPLSDFELFQIILYLHKYNVEIFLV
jgi:hypothetical protein